MASWRKIFKFSGSRTVEEIFVPWTNSGYCHCCRSSTEFQACASWLRDNYFCAKCRSIPRQRHIQLVLDNSFAGWEKLSIHESSPSTWLIGQYAENYTTSQLMPNVPLGANVNGVLCQDLERLTFSDNSFDLFITQDVMEHVFQPSVAIAEIQRVLKPGGAHIFTAPKHRDLLYTRQRARRRKDDSVEYLLPKEYHGSPVGDGRVLVTWDYGYDFEELLSEWSGSPVMTHHLRDRSKGIDALFNEVFVIKKSSLPEASPHD